MGSFCFSMLFRNLFEKTHHCAVGGNEENFKVGTPVFQPFYEMKLKTSSLKVLKPVKISFGATGQRGGWVV